MFSVKGQWHREAEREKETGVLTVLCAALWLSLVWNSLTRYCYTCFTDNITENDFQNNLLILLMTQVIISFLKLDPPCCHVNIQYP